MKTDRQVQGVFALAMGILLTFAEVSQAKTNEQRLHLSVYGGGIFPSDDEIDPVGTIGGRVTYDLFGNVEIGADVSWQQYDDTLDGIKLGEVRHLPLYGILKLKLPVDDTFSIYALGGAGVSFWSYKEKISTISADDDTGFTWKLGLGLEAALAKDISVFLEGGYYWAEYDITGTVLGIPVSGTTEADSAFVNGGATLSF